MLTQAGPHLASLFLWYAVEQFGTPCTPEVADCVGTLVPTIMSSYWGRQESVCLGLQYLVRPTALYSTYI